MNRHEIEVRLTGPGDADARGRELGRTQACVTTEDGDVAARGLYASVGGVEEEERAVVYVFPMADAP